MLTASFAGEGDASVRQAAQPGWLQPYGSKTTMVTASAAPNRIAAVPAGRSRSDLGQRYHLRSHGRRLAVPVGDLGPFQSPGGWLEIRGQFGDRAG